MSGRRRRSAGRSALVKDGDIIAIDAVGRHAPVELSDAELEKRRAAWQPRQTSIQSGALWQYAQPWAMPKKAQSPIRAASAETHCYADI